MLNELMKRMDEHNENLIKRDIEPDRNTITEMKNTLEEFKSRVDKAED